MPADEATWEDDGTRTAVPSLVAAGVSEQAATAIVEDVAAAMRAETSDG
jgi:C4-dicarboxylate transporter